MCFYPHEIATHHARNHVHSLKLACNVTKSAVVELRSGINRIASKCVKWRKHGKEHEQLMLRWSGQSYENNSSNSTVASVFTSIPMLAHVDPRPRQDSDEVSPQKYALCRGKRYLCLRLAEAAHQGRFQALSLCRAVQGNNYAA